MSSSSSHVGFNRQTEIWFSHLSLLSQDYSSWARMGTNSNTHSHTQRQCYYSNIKMFTEHEDIQGNRTIKHPTIVWTPQRPTSLSQSFCVSLKHLCCSYKYTIINPPERRHHFHNYKGYLHILIYFYCEHLCSSIFQKTIYCICLLTLKIN